VTGAKAKGGDYKPKSCPGCELKLTAGNVGVRNLVVSAKPEDRPTALFIDGDDINHRYQVVTPTRFLLLDEPHWTYKPAELYASPKLLIRQAGVGVWAILDETDARCPQSVYLYRLKKQRTDEGYDPRYVLACLLSRTMAYYSVKRFGEGDPAKAHVKLTHARLEDFPIPRVDFADAVQRKQHDSIAQNVELMLKGTASAKGAEDYAVEVALRSLWGLGPEEGLRVNEQLKLLPPSQLLAEMFDNSD